MNLLLAVFRITRSDDNRKVRNAIAWRMAEAVFATVPYGVLYVALQRMFSATFDLPLLLWLTLVLLLSLGLQLVCNVASNVGGFIGGTGMLCDLRLQLADHLRRLPLGFYTRRQTGDLTAVLAENTTHVEEAFTHLTGELFGRLGIAALTAALMLLIDVRLGLLTLACAALGGGLIHLLKHRFQALGRAKLAQKAEVGSRLLEFVQGIKVIRAFGLSLERFGDIEAAMNTLRRLSIRIEVIAGVLAIGFSVVLEFGFLALLAGAVCLAVKGQLSQALLIMMLIMGHRFFSMMSESSALLAQLAFYEKSFERIDGLLKEPCLPEPARPQVPQHYDIEVRNLSFSHAPGVATLTDISFKAAAGTVTALVGASGSGKTTLAHLLARFQDADSGQVLVGGVDVRDMRQDDLLACIAFVFQDTHLFNDTVANNLRIGRPEASEAELIGAAQAARCHDFIMALPDGYQTVLSAAQGLSGGERQRLSIARALLKDAPIVILDEATASLDAENESAIRQALSALMRDKTVIVIAHRLYTLTDVDQILVLEHSRLKEQGTHPQLLERNGLYAHFWAQQRSTRQWRFRPSAPPTD